MWRPSYYKKVKKDYQRKNSPNPFFRRKAPGKRRHLGPGLGLLGLAGFIFLIWFFLAAPFWRLQNLKITGLTQVSSSNIEALIYKQTLNKRWLFFSESNIFLFNTAQATEQIIANYNLAGLKIKKVWPHTLSLLVSERPYAFIFQEGNAQYYASSDGYIIKQPAVAPADLKKYFILENKNNGTLIGTNNKIAIGADYLNFIMDLDAALSRHADLPIDRFIIDQEFNTIKVKFINGPLAYFNIKDTVAAQIANLLLVKNEKIKDNFSKTDYIDLRYGNRVFINPDFN